MRQEIWTLPWLPEPGADFRDRCRALKGATGEGIGSELRTLATHRLNSTEALALARVVRPRLATGTSLAPLAPFRLAVLASTTVDFLADQLPAAAARHGVALDVALAEYDQIVQTALDPAAPVFASAPDAALLLFDHHGLALDRACDAAEAASRVEAALEKLRLTARGLQDGTGVQVIAATLAVPPGALFGSLDASIAGTVRAQVTRFNEGLRALARELGLILFDVAALAEQVGTARWSDPVMWNLYKVAVAPDCQAYYADALASLIGAIRGRSRKCLVLDCDNTLWGGVIGDDGLAGIAIGEGSAEGEAFAAVQRLALDLKSRGILLAVCSKNEDATARAAFRDHPDMLLRETDIAVFQANWTDKASNLEAIARTLDFGLDALVLLDDNAAERAQMRAALPAVAVPELPADPAHYPLWLSSAGYFQAVSFSEEDGLRAQGYAANAMRAEVRGQARDLGDYLRALEMAIDIRPFDAIGTPRIAQLVNKSNQFNLTTRRYTEAEIAALRDDPDVVTLQVRLRDKFSDFGMIGVVIATPEAPGALAVDLWVMSCRVLGREVERAMLGGLVAAARGAGASALQAAYLPTAKNAMVAEHYDRLGFTRIAEEPEGTRRYRLDLADFVVTDLPFGDAAG